MKNLIIIVSLLVIFPVAGFVFFNNSEIIEQSAVSSEPVTVTDANFEEIVLNSDKLFVVDFYASWCGNCKKLSPIIEELSAKHGDMIAFGKLEVEENPVTAGNYKVDAVPRILAFHKGKVVKDIEGLKTQEELEEILVDVCKKCEGM